MGFIVAVDGPAGSGKGTVTKKVAEKMNLRDIDTGDCIELTGYQLMTSGITIHIDAMQDAKIFHYQVKE